ncbi:MAG: type III pantothenate kinase [Lachnospiraceae bacterium]|nr:type III pantothenate kinase [Lachnospiraceae bacterium]
MLLVVDIGNTNITMGVFDGEEMEGPFRMTTTEARTSDEYGVDLANLLNARHIGIEQIEDVIISSVVPGMMHSFQNAIRKYLGRVPLVVGPGTKTGIRLGQTNPRSVGADRIVDAVAAYEIYGGPVLAIDFGTATTYDLITEDGTFAAGVICPGIRISAKALSEGTSKLPEVEIRKMESILARDTISSIQAGLIFGYIGQTEYIIDRMKEESGYTDMHVVATGGLGKIIAEQTKKIDIYDPTMTLKGLKIIYQKMKK